MFFAGSQHARGARLACLLLMALAGILALAACGGGESKGADVWTFQKVDPSDRTYTIDDLVAAGFKKSKQYDVEGLPQGADAWLGFWGPDASNRKDYELRFYASHQDAVEFGTALAEEGTGKGMEARKDSQTWQEGAKHRWFAGGVTDVSSPGSRQAPGPRFGDFAIYGNVILLCEGADSGQALERCQGLVRALRESTTE